MNCGVYCVKRFLEIKGIREGSIVDELSELVNDEGLRVADLMDVLARHNISCQAYYSNTPYWQTPYIMLDAARGHYYLVEQVSGLFVHLSDVNRENIVLFRCLFRLFWQKYYITMCYNTCN